MELQLIIINPFDTSWTKHSITGRLASTISRFHTDRFFSWDVLKDRVYATKPQNLQALKDAISTEMGRLPMELCQKACQAVSERLQLCKDLEGEHIEQFL